MDYNMAMHSTNLSIPQAKIALAMAYVPMQPQITKMYSAMDALRIGTLFPELDKPWLGKRGHYHG